MTEHEEVATEWEDLIHQRGLLQHSIVPIDDYIVQRDPTFDEDDENVASDAEHVQARGSDLLPLEGGSRTANSA